ncbi:MAG: hypothetical protein DRJ03_01730 [Chloroflexi bacterium]|nr:MAG: hypothetical protein DRJ03_01730 [Chloroflexota bacterium]
MARPSVVTRPDQNNWLFQRSYVERLMDHAAISSAHPDNTLVMAGPARQQRNGEATIWDQMLPIGMVQNINVTQTKPTQPLMAVGSGRMFFVSGKAQGTAAVARLFVNGRNLLRVLYTNVVRANIDVNKFDDYAAVPKIGGAQSQFFANLDSELFMIPFGMAIVFRNKAHQSIGAFYLELCMINNWTINFSAGQNLILENVNLLFDRLQPIALDNVGTPSGGYPFDPADNEFKSMFMDDGQDINPGLADR